MTNKWSELCYLWFYWASANFQSNQDISEIVHSIPKYCDVLVLTPNQWPWDCLPNFFLSFTQANWLFPFMIEWILITGISNLSYVLCLSYMQGIADEWGSIFTHSSSSGWMGMNKGWIIRTRILFILYSSFIHPPFIIWIKNECIGCGYYSKGMADEWEMVPSKVLGIHRYPVWLERIMGSYW